MSFLTLLLSRFFHEENYYDHKKTNITLSNTPMYLGGKHPLVVLIVVVLLNRWKLLYNERFVEC